jgi:hypothetical protein
MKTNIIMKSSDRTLFGAIIRQETKTGMLNISDLEAIAAKRNALKDYTIKHTSELISRKDNLERIYYILKKQDVINVDMSTFIGNVENEGITTTLKIFGAWKTTGARHTKTSWANPYIWMLLALEMSPEIYGEAVIWLSDKLIINRIEAGNMYLGLTNAIAKWNPDGTKYATLAKALNFIVFNRHEPGIRNTSTANELKQLEDLEKKMVFAIEMGYIKSFDNLLSELRRIWKLKFGSFIKYLSYESNR